MPLMPSVSSQDFDSHLWLFASISRPGSVSRIPSTLMHTGVSQPPHAPAPLLRWWLMISLNPAYVRPLGIGAHADCGTAAAILTLMPVPSTSHRAMPPVACPDHGSSHSTWSLTSNAACTDVRRQLPLAYICHQFGTLPSAEVIRRITSMPLRCS